MSEELWMALARSYLSDYELSKSYNEKDPKVMKRLIKKKISAMINEKLKVYGEKRLPILTDYNSRFITHDRRCTVTETDNVKYGKLIVTPTGFEIYIAKNDEAGQKMRTARKRTFLAHELGHTYLYDTRVTPPKPLLDADFIASALSKVDYGPEEGLPYEFGRELLIPTFILEKSIPRDASMGVFFQACKKFLVTRQFMAKRLFWNIYDYERNENYWSNSILIMYPLSKLSKSQERPPTGPNEIYKGKYLKNFNVAKNWETFENVIDTCKNRVNQLVMFNESLTFRNIKLIIEATYTQRTPSDGGFLYILVHPTCHTVDGGHEESS